MKPLIRLPSAMAVAVVLVFVAPCSALAGSATYAVRTMHSDTSASASGHCHTCSTFYVPHSTPSTQAHMRWSINVPKGATITSARLLLKYDAEGSDAPSTVRIQAIDQDDCPPYAENPFTWAVSAPYADVVVGDWTAGDWTALGNFAPVVQAFIDRPGYAYHNHIGLRAVNVSGSWKRALTFDGDNSSLDHSGVAPRLEVTWTGGEAVVELWMAEPHVRLAQKVYVQLLNANPTDRLVATLDGAVIFEKTGDLQAEEVFTADYRSLGAGPHELRVEVRDAGGAVRGSAVKSWTQLRNGIPAVGIDENNAVCVDGEPFFPVTPWGLDPRYFDDWAPYVNCLHGQGWNVEDSLAGWSGYLDDATPTGLPVMGPSQGQYWPNGDTSNIVEDPPGSGNWIHYTHVDIDALAAYVNGTKDHPMLLMWSWKDEPDLGGSSQYIPATEVRRWMDKGHELDDNHPHYLNIVGYSLTGNPPYPNYGNNKAGSYCFLYSDQWSSAMGDNPPFDRKTVCTDIISHDYYPYENMARNGYQSVPDCMLAFDRLRQWNYDLLPAFAWIETCDIRVNETPPIGAAELHNLTWLHVIHGAKGIQWFHYFQSTPPENYAVMQQFRDDITALTRVVLGPEEVPLVVTDTEVGTGRVDMAVRRHEGTLWILAAEVLGEPESVRFDVEGMPAGSLVTVFGEGRTIVAQAGHFEDAFDARAVHIYSIGGVLPGEVAGWEVVSQHGDNEIAVEAHEGYVHAHAAGLSTLRVTLNRPLDPATLSAGCFSVIGASSGDVSSQIGTVAPSLDNMAVTITFSESLPDGDRYTVSVLPHLKAVGGESYGGDAATRTIASLAGDVDASGDVAPADVVAAREAVGSIVSAATSRSDVDGSGEITGADVHAVKSREGNALP